MSKEKSERQDVIHNMAKDHVVQRLVDQGSIFYFIIDEMPSEEFGKGSNKF